MSLTAASAANHSCLGRYYFMPCLEEFHRRYPGIKIVIVNRTSPETLHLLEQGLIDFGIVSFQRETSRFLFRRLLTIQDIDLPRHPASRNR